MEYIWYIIAAVGAGIGTGLAGLSAATVMVPILIVLCPSFTGETGAYQATAIALASDILGSAVTSLTYAKNKNIDLKRGWIMLVCILIMSTVGSYVAWLAGNVVLGSFTLFLTFFIGIRFLVKPDTSKDNPVSKGESLDIKGIVISLFFGLTIGFGTGFVGTGGGMMMLVVFTMFLGMELKTAVGTSTFIMTFTALIASFSHIVIHPAILLERWNVLILCIIIATFTSLLSAQFANRVKSQTVGLVTGIVLTILGATMLILHYWTFLSKITLFIEVLDCIGTFILFVIPCVIILFMIKYFLKLPPFVFRKLLHMVAFSCTTLIIIVSKSWLSASITSCFIAICLYPVLSLFEENRWYHDFLVQKKMGEIKKSLLMLFFMIAFMTFISWGIFNKPYIAVLSVLMWGTGDAAAALIGIPYGKHKVNIKCVDGKKSWEGTLAMIFVSFICGLSVCLLYYQFSIHIWLKILIGAIIGAITELLSPSEYDTVTVPIVILVILLFLSI